MFGPNGREFLTELSLSTADRTIIEAHLSVIDEYDTQIESLEDEIETKKSSNSTSGGHFAREVDQVYRELQKSDEGLRIDDLRDRLGKNLPTLHSALGSLVDHGLAHDRGTNGHRFWAVGNDLSRGGFDE